MPAGGGLRVSQKHLRASQRGQGPSKGVSKPAISPSRGTKSCRMKFEVQPKGYQGQLEESLGQQKGSEGKPEGSEGEPEGSKQAKNLQRWDSLGSNWMSLGACWEGIGSSWEGL